MVIFATLLLGALVVSTVSTPATRSAGRCAWRLVATHAAKGELYNVTVVGKRNVWAVGLINPGTGSSFQPFVLRWNGSRWQRIITARSDSPDLFAAIAFAARDDAWAVGRGDPLHVVEHWDGTIWKIVPAANLGRRTVNLDDVATVAGDDVWAVGAVTISGDSGATQALVEHWNGRTWTAAATPDVGQSWLSGVAAISRTDVWAVGNRRLDTLMEHWDGKRWSVVPNPIQHGFFVDIAAVSARDVWAVGGTRGRRLIEHWNGRGWRVAASPRVAGSLGSLTAVSKNDIWAAGDRGPNRDQGLVEHWNGRTWRIVPSPTVKDLFAIAAVGKNDLWGVGRVGGSNERAVSEHFSCLR